MITIQITEKFYNVKDLAYQLGVLASALNGQSEIVCPTYEIEGEEEQFPDMEKNVGELQFLPKRRVPTGNYRKPIKS